MDVLALILAAVAMVVFLLEAHDRRQAGAVSYRVPLALALLTASWICQATTITGHLVNF